MALSSALSLVAACGPSVASMTLEPAVFVLHDKAETKTLKATPKKENGEVNADALAKIKWTSADPSIATVVNGTVTAVKSGDAIITAEIGEVRASVRARVSIPVSIELDPKEVDLPGVGKSLDLKVIVKDEAGREAVEPPLMYSILSSTIARAADGKVQAVGLGHTTLMVSAGALKATAPVFVHPPEVARIDIAPGQRELEAPGGALRLTATLLDSKGDAIRGLPIAWTSSDEKLATVSNEGLVTAQKRGKVTITAAAQDKTVEVEIEIQGAK